MKSNAIVFVLLAAVFATVSAHPVRMQRVLSTLRSSVLAQTSQPICDNIYCDVPACQGNAVPTFDPSVSCCPFCPVLEPYASHKTCQELLPASDHDSCCSSAAPGPSPCYAADGYCFCDQACYHYGDCCEDILEIGCHPPQAPVEPQPDEEAPEEEETPAQVELNAVLQFIAQHHKYNSNARN